MSMLAVTDQDFESKVLNSATPVVVDFWAEWCGPCKQIAPALEEIAAEMDGKITVAKVNIDENPDAPSRYNVRGIPMLLLFKGGEVVSNSVGAKPKAKIVEWIEGAI